MMIVGVTVSRLRLPTNFMPAIQPAHIFLAIVGNLIGMKMTQLKMVK